MVLLCGLSRRLNRDDLKRPVLFHPELGVGPKGLDRERMVEYPTLARQAVARQLEREMMAEELRLLYVAMTRAKEKLILSIAARGGERRSWKSWGRTCLFHPPPWRWSASRAWAAGCCFTPWPGPRRPPCGAWRGCRRCPRGLWGPPGIFDG